MNELPPDPNVALLPLQAVVTLAGVLIAMAGLAYDCWRARA